ncbi:MAG: thiosulfate oxidation carrier protein SoxY [Chlorobiaceae bacterium]|nr:thiosulfate oxidation carrier protein SoxY [Chlorobiaceae bacterium]
MGISRRQFFKAFSGMVASLSVLTVTAERLFAKWNAGAFHAGKLDDAVREKYGALPVEDSAAIKLTVPEIAEDGAFVPVSISSDMPGITNITIYSETNVFPLVASFDVLPRMRPDLSLRVRMAETGKITAIAQAGGRLYRSSRLVVVSVGGCG